MALAAVFQEKHSCTDAKKALNILTSPSFVLLSPSLPLVLLLLPLLLMKMCWRALNSKKVQEEEEENTLNINELKFFKKKQRRN